MGLLPHADSAIVPIEKLRDYVLDPEHPVGKHKARVFAAALGIRRNDAPRLKSLILKGILKNEAVDQGDSIHGARYRVDFSSHWPWRIDNGSYNVDR